MKCQVFLIIFLLQFSLCFGQKEATVWVWGHEVGIDFNYNRFTPLFVKDFEQFGGSASLSDPHTGELMFYTDGRHVWNSRHTIMPNGSELYGGYWTSQAALFVPCPGKQGFYYLFTTKSYSDTLNIYEVNPKVTGFYYSLIDVRLDGGKGDIIRDKKNILLLEKSTEKLTAIPHDNGQDYWIITHEWGSDRFVVFLLTSSGLSEPTYFPIGKVYTPENARGKLVPSPNSKMLACAVYGERELGSLELFDFDASTGIIYNLRELGKEYLIFSSNFSPDNSKLYYSYSIANPLPFDTQKSVQLDLSLEDTEQIIETRTDIHYIDITQSGGADTLGGGDFQMALDGRMYSTINNLYYDNENGRIRRKIFYLEKPNKVGMASEPKYRDFTVGDLRGGILLGDAHLFPNFMQYYFNNLEPLDNDYDESVCQDLKLIAYPNPTKDNIRISSHNQNNHNCLYPLEIQVFDVLGRQLLQQRLRSEETNQINFNNYSPGMYVVMVENRFQKKIFKIIRD